MSDLPEMPDGLTAFLLPEGPQMWHEFALGLDFTDPLATIDLLLAAETITLRDDCDGATAALILAKALQAGFHRGACPAGFVEGATRAFAARLTGALSAGRTQPARLALPPQARALVLAQFAALGLPVPQPGRRRHHPRHGFAGWHPVARPGLAQAA